jgi:hypothetical protein
MPGVSPQVLGMGCTSKLSVSIKGRVSPNHLSNGVLRSLVGQTEGTSVFVLMIYIDARTIIEMAYQWNHDKAAANLRKNGIDFADAAEDGMHDKTFLCRFSKLTCGFADQYVCLVCGHVLSVSSNHVSACYIGHGGHLSRHSRHLWVFPRLSG